MILGDPVFEVGNRVAYRLKESDSEDDRILEAFMKPQSVVLV